MVALSPPPPLINLCYCIVCFRLHRKSIGKYLTAADSKTNTTRLGQNQLNFSVIRYLEREVRLGDTPPTSPLPFHAIA